LACYQGSLVGLYTPDYKSLCAAVTIFYDSLIIEIHSRDAIYTSQAFYLQNLSQMQDY